VTAVHDLLVTAAVIAGSGLGAWAWFRIPEMVRKRRKHPALPEDGEPLTEREQEVIDRYVAAELAREPYADDPMRRRLP
jgi:hypothetical protein